MFRAGTGANARSTSNDFRAGIEPSFKHKGNMRWASERLACHQVYELVETAITPMLLWGRRGDCNGLQVESIWQMGADAVR